MQTAQSAVKIHSLCRILPSEAPHPSLHSSSLQDGEDEKEGKTWKGAEIKLLLWMIETPNVTLWSPQCWLFYFPVCVCFLCRWSPEVKMRQISSLLWWKMWPVRTSRFVMNPASCIICSFSSACVVLCGEKEVAFCIKAFFTLFFILLACNLCMILSHF